MESLAVEIDCRSCSVLLPHMNLCAFTMGGLLGRYGMVEV